MDLEIVDGKAKTRVRKRPPSNIETSVHSDSPDDYAAFRDSTTQRSASVKSR